MAAGDTKNFIVGIDEVGRGPLAGPIVVCAVLMPRGLKMNCENLRDSKKLTAPAREKWTRYIKSHPRLEYALARVGPDKIDRMNITRAANLAARRAFTKLVRNHTARAAKYSVYLDGGLYLGNGSGHSDCYRVRTVIKGDEKVRAVALASIIAKTHRDRMMVRYAGRFPEYGFESHKGYGTRMHTKAVRRCGPSPIHRLTFLRNHARMSLVK